MDEGIRTRLPLWIDNQVIPAIREALGNDKLSAQVSTEDEKVFIEYDSSATYCLCVASSGLSSATCRTLSFAQVSPEGGLGSNCLRFLVRDTYECAVGF